MSVPGLHRIRIKLRRYRGKVYKLIFSPRQIPRNLYNKDVSGAEPELHKAQGYELIKYTDSKFNNTRTEITT